MPYSQIVRRANHRLRQTLESRLVDLESKEAAVRAALLRATDHDAQTLKDDLYLLQAQRRVLLLRIDNLSLPIGPSCMD